MEYKVIENGVPVWYKLTGNKLLPLKGRCAKDKPLYYEGMLVVPNNVTAKQAPKVEGMIIYQKDNNKLYVQGDGKLNALAEEKVLSLYITYFQYPGFHGLSPQSLVSNSVKAFV